MEAREQEYHEALEVARDIYRQSKAGLDAEITRLQESIKPQIAALKAQKAQLWLDDRKRRQELKRQYEQPGEHSAEKNRRKQAFNIKRYIGGRFSEWKTRWLDMENAGIGFEMKEDCIQFGITIPYKDPNQQTENGEQESE